MGLPVKAAPGSPIQLTESEFETGFVNRVLHRDVDSAFKSLIKVAGSANHALSSVSEQVKDLSRYRSADVAAHNNTVIAVDLHSNRLNALEGRAASFETLRNADVASATQTVAVVNGHSNQLTTLIADSGVLKTRVTNLEALRNSDRTAAAKTVDVVDLHSKKFQEVAQRFATLTAENAAMVRSMASLENRLQLAFDQSACSGKSSQVHFEEITLSFRELTLKVGGLLQSREDLTARLIYVEKEQDALDERQKREAKECQSQLVKMAQRIKELVDGLATLSAWKEEATRKHERHESILLRSHKLQVTLAETLATMGQEQQYLFHMTKGVDSKLLLLLEKQGIPAPKLEIPQGDQAAPFRAILTDIKEVREAFQ